MTHQATAASHSRERLASDFDALATHAEELMRTTAALSGNGVAAAREKLGESLARVRDQFDSMSDLARDRSRQAIDATQEYVHNNPWQAIGLGVLVGLTLGVIATSNWRSNSGERSGKQ